MAVETWVYYVPCIVNNGGSVGFAVKLYTSPRRIESLEDIQRMIDTLTAELIEGEPDVPKGTLPVVPLNFQLITAKRVEDAGPPKH